MTPARSAVSLTQRDRALLDVLTRRVRVLSLEQVARTWWSTSRANAARRLRALEAAGWTRSLDLLAHPLVELDGPLIAWAPGDPTPAIQAVSHRLQSRWREHPCVHRAFIATERAGVRLSGHGGRAPRPTEATHDIHMAEVYLAFLQTQPARAAGWIGEEGLFSLGYGQGAKLPDAMIVDAAGARTAVEFGGAYRPAKLKEFHQFCETERLPYEVW